jgi:hypothetical protein
MNMRTSGGENKIGANSDDKTKMEKRLVAADKNQETLQSGGGD